MQRLYFNPHPPFELKKRKEGEGGEGRKGKKNEKNNDPLESHPIFTGACFDLNVLIEVSQTVFSQFISNIVIKRAPLVQRVMTF